VRADRVDERPFVVRLFGQPALEDIVRFRGDREAVPDADRVDRLAQRRLGEGRRDPALVHAVFHGGPAGEEVPRIEADAHGHLQLLPGGHRLVVHVAQVPRHDPAGPAGLVQDQDPMERQVPNPRSLRDPYARGNVASRILREELRDRHRREVDVGGGLRQELRALDEVRVLRMGLCLQQLREELVRLDADGARDPFAGGPQVRDRRAARERNTMTTAITPITKRNPMKAPNPSVARASIRTPSGGGGGGGALAGKTCIHIDMVSYPAFASAGTTFSTRIVRLCSPSPTARNCGVWTRADAPGASESERGVTPIRTTSPFGRESISSTVAEIAAVSPTLTTVTVTSTTSPS